MTMCLVSYRLILFFAHFCYRRSPEVQRRDLDGDRVCFLDVYLSISNHHIFSFYKIICLDSRLGGVRLSIFNGQNSESKRHGHISKIIILGSRGCNTRGTTNSDRYMIKEWDGWQG